MSTTGSVPPLQVCTKVAGYLEQGQRLENLSWRLWHLQNLMVDTDNAKSKREFKKVAKNMGDKLDKEKGRSVLFSVLHPRFSLTISNFQSHLLAGPSMNSRHLTSNPTRTPKSFANAQRRGSASARPTRMAQSSVCNSPSHSTNPPRRSTRRSTNRTSDPLPSSPSGVASLLARPLRALMPHLV
jgi:hypothetical protein